MAGFGDGAAFFNFIASIFSATAQREASQQVQNFNEAQQVASENEAENIQKWTEYNVQQQRRSDKLKRSKMKVQYIKAGVTTDPGTTSALVLAEQEIQDEMAALSIQAKGITEASRLRSQASFFQVAGRNVRDIGRTNAQATLFSGIATSANISAKSGGVFSQKSTGSSGTKVKEDE